jgi:hypothetical protein
VEESVREGISSGGQHMPLIGRAGARIGGRGKPNLNIAPLHKMRGSWDRVLGHRRPRCHPYAVVCRCRPPPAEASLPLLVSFIGLSLGVSSEAVVMVPVVLPRPWHRLSVPRRTNLSAPSHCGLCCPWLLESFLMTPHPG